MANVATRLVMFGAAILGAVAVRAAWPHLFGPRVMSSEQLAAGADTVNRQLPMTIDAETKAIHVAGFDHVLEYQYQLVNVAAAAADTAVMRAGFTPRLRNIACTSPNTRPTFLDHGVTMRYTYVDRDHRPLLSIDVTPGDCRPTP